MTENRESIEIDIKRVMLALWKKAWLILLVGGICAFALFAYSRFTHVPQYAASTKLYVNNSYGSNTVGFSSSQIMAAQDLANTYIVILESRTVMNGVTEKTGLDYTYSQLCDMVTAIAVNETEVFQVNVTCSNPDHAVQIANAIADILPEVIRGMIEGSSVRVVDYAEETGVPLDAGHASKALIGLALGILASAAAVIILDLLDTSISSEDYLGTTYSTIPLLAVVPDAEESGNYGYYKGYYARDNRNGGANG